MLEICTVKGLQVLSHHMYYALKVHKDYNFNYNNTLHEDVLHRVMISGCCKSIQVDCYDANIMGKSCYRWLHNTTMSLVPYGMKIAFNSLYKTVTLFYYLCEFF